MGKPENEQGPVCFFTDGSRTIQLNILRSVDYVNYFFPDFFTMVVARRKQLVVLRPVNECGYIRAMARRKTGHSTTARTLHA